MSAKSEFIKLVHRHFDGYLLLAELGGLVVVAVATTVAMGHEAWNMVASHQVTLTDLLLMFLYLEVLAMVGQYFKAGQLPVRFPLYIAMVAIARDLILGVREVTELRMIASTGAILLLAAGVLLIRYGQIKYPCEDDEKPKDTE